MRGRTLSQAAEKIHVGEPASAWHPLTLKELTEVTCHARYYTMYVSYRAEALTESPSGSDCPLPARLTSGLRSDSPPGPFSETPPSWHRNRKRRGVASKAGHAIHAESNAADHALLSTSTETRRTILRASNPLICTIQTAKACPQHCMSASMRDSQLESRTVKRVIPF